MVQCCGIAPEQILTMTYTVAATQEMRSRFAARFGAELAERMQFRTINGLSAMILQYYSRRYQRQQPQLITRESDLTPAADPDLPAGKRRLPHRKHPEGTAHGHHLH